MKVAVGSCTNPGRVRPTNQDSLGDFDSPDGGPDKGRLLVLADGMGGEAGGEIASRLAVDVVGKMYFKCPSTEPAAALELSMMAANQAIHAQATASAELHRMGTTCTALVLQGSRAWVAHVGDSRCYLLRHGRAAPLTRDHTLAAEQLRMGLITSREANSAQTSHVLSRSVGAGLFVNVDTTEQQIFANDILLLCSDGLHNSVGSDDIVRLVSPDRPLADSAAALVTLAKERDGGDNISVQLIRIREVERVGMYRGRHYKVR